MSEKEINTVIAKNLNYFLNKTGKTQIDLSLFMDVSQATVSNWCKGLKMPRMDKIDKICLFFNINRSDLMEDKSNDPVQKEQFSVHNTKKDLTCIIKEEFGERAEKVLNLFLKLDEIDQARIIERIETYLESEKYSSEEGYKHA